MTLYMIRGDTVTAYASPPAGGSEDELRVRSAKEIEASRLTNAQMAAIWNALPGTAPVAKFKDRNTAVRRLWAAFGQFPVSSAPAGGSAGPSAGSKQARVIGLLQRASEIAAINALHFELGARTLDIREPPTEQ